MSEIVRKRISRSAEVFQNNVWPRIRSGLGEGEVVRVEGFEGDALRGHLDVLAGVDFFQVVEGYGVRGIGQRVQWTIDPFYTFTVRCSTVAGGATEIHKRMHAIKERAHGWIYPYMTIQSYCHPETDEPISVAAVHTIALMLFIEERLDQLTTEENSQDGNGFLVVPWDELKSADVEVRRWDFRR